MEVNALCLLRICLADVPGGVCCMKPAAKGREWGRDLRGERVATAAACLLLAGCGQVLKSALRRGKCAFEWMWSAGAAGGVWGSLEGS